MKAINNSNSSILKVEGKRTPFGLKVTEIKAGADLKAGIYQSEGGFFRVGERGEVKNILNSEARAAFDDSSACEQSRTSFANEFRLFFQSSLEDNLRFF